MAGDPAGRGPIATSCRRCSQARLESNFTDAGWAATLADTSSTAISHPACNLKSAVCNLTWAVSRSLFGRHVVARLRADVDLPWPCDFLFRIQQHLFPLGD